MSQDSDMNEKLDKILEKIESLDKKMDSVESKMDSRLTKVEDQCGLLIKKSNKHDRCQNYVLNEVAKLKIKVNMMEQDKLKNNIMIRGVKEIEKDDKELDLMIDTILASLTDEFESQDTKSVRRIGMKKQGIPRLVLVEMVTANAKLKIMQTLKDKNLNCAQFNNNGVVWGKNEERIYLSDHFTPASNNIFYQARQLKKKDKIKYAWSKFGNIYVKKDENSRAVRVESLEQLAQFDKQLSSDEDVGVTETENESESEPVMDTDVEAASRSPSKQSKRKLNRSQSDPPKKSPRPKRAKKITKH